MIVGSGLVGSGAAFLSCACGRAHAQQGEKGGAIPGGEKSAKSTMLGAGADLLQSRSPVSAINMYLNGFHFYADDMGRQIEAHHYCSHVTEEFYQCVIYDGNEAHSRLIGIEYIVSERIFKSLPEEEKALWHSHRHEALAAADAGNTGDGAAHRHCHPRLCVAGRQLANLVLAAMRSTAY
jgi:hypothetical protein